MRQKNSMRAVAVVACLIAASVSANPEIVAGRTEASYGVTPNGGVAYTIPIRTTDGINGLTPQLAITYSGPGARSILGVGFALSGISYITPCRKTIAQDLNAAPVLLTSADRYCLDGARLRAVTGTYGATNTIYRTELDQLVRVTSYDSTSNIPGWFKVEMPDGMVYEYGKTADSKLLASPTGNPRPQFWAVSKIADKNGNAVVFHYDTNATLRRFRPNYISYTEGVGSGKYRISFVYESDPLAEPTRHYTPSTTGGAFHVDDKLLERIDLSHDDGGFQVYRKILLVYGAGAGTNQRLQSVQECVPGSPDVCLPATTLGWQSATPGHGSATTTNLGLYAARPLDVNGDGIDDIVGYASGTWRYALGNASGGYGSVINSGVAAVNPHKAAPIEWNGDGRWDLLIDWSDGKWRVLVGTANGLSHTAVAAGPGAGVSSNLNGQNMAIADVNGDGRDDLITVTLDAYIALVVRYNSPTGLGSATTAYYNPGVKVLGSGFPETVWETALRRPDFNGDSRSDLMVFGCVWEPDIYPSGECVATGWFQLLSQGTGYFNHGYLPYSSYTLGVRYADVNGDGLTDVIYPAFGNSQWYVGFGQGDSYLSEVPGPSFSGYLYYLTLIGDYDGDGIDDLYAAHVGSGTWHVFRGISSGLSTSPIATGVSTNCTSWTRLEATGDGLADLGCSESAGGAWKTFARVGLPGDRLTAATDGFGNQVAFNYLPMSNGTVYTKGTGATFPSRDYQGTSPLVREMEVSPAGGTAYQLTYKYADGRVHVQGRSFLGMGKREVTDERNGMHSIETYRQDYPYTGSPAQVVTKQSATGNVIQDVTHTYANHVLDSTSGNQRYLPYRSKTVTKAYEVGGLKNGLQITEVTEERTVNTFGNSTFVSLKAEDKDSGSAEYGSVWRTEVTSTYSENTTDWCIGPPLTRSEKRILPSGVNETRAASWEVATYECRVTKETIAPGAGSALSLVTDIGYDSCGNVNSISSYPAGTTGQQRTTAINYGSRCQRPETITNAEGHTSSIAYSWPLALPSSQTDPNGIVTALFYDGFGRLTRRENPDDTDVTIALAACKAETGWCGKDNTVRMKVTQSLRNNLDATIRSEETFLDGFGRARWAHSDSLESGPAMVQTAFDAFGRPSAQSQPYFTGGTLYSTVFTRDLIGRVTQVNAPISESQASGRITGFSYEGRDLKVTDPKGNVTTRRSNALGQLRAVVDPNPGGTTNYAYRPFGELASITDAASNATTWEYNERGLVKKTIDPDSGTWEYEHNAFGEMTKIRDAKTSAPNFTTEFTFDKLGRPKTRTDVPESLVTTWNWGTSATNKNIGQLASIAMSAGGYSESYFYDSIGRLNEQRVTADGTTHYINLTYVPATGLLDTLEYPTSSAGYRFKVAYQYSNGLLKRVTNVGGSTVFWEAVNTDAFGHYQQESFGNGVQTFTQFDQASGLMRAREGGVGGGTGLIHSQVDWDLNGNLKQRKDLKLSPAVTEDFFYDNLNRFDYSERTPAGGATATNAGVRLDAIGNILWKKDVCPTGVDCYTYHATKKRAVISAGGHSFGYDANGNMNVRNGSNIGYTSYNLPNGINAPGGYSSTLSYGAFRNRFKQIAVTPTGTETTIYVAGLFEKVTRTSSGTEYRHLIQGGRGTAAIYTRTSGGSGSTAYVHTDHLGSPELITGSSGTVLVRPSFSAYGERRDGSDWDGPPSAGDLATIANLTRRGFTGHEHLDSVGLIHMNGRVYEPVAGRFLSRDPFIDGFASSQGMNGYAYVHNNPLKFVDPSGYCFVPAPGMSDEEAAALITQCADAYDSQWDAIGSDRWCAAMDMGCQQQVLQQRIAEQTYTRTIFNDMLAGRQTFTGNEIVVTATRLGGETMSWAQSQLARDPFANTWVSATLPDGSRGYIPATSSTQGVERQSAGPLHGRQPAGANDAQGLVSATGALNTTLEFVAEIERSSAAKLLARSGVVLGYLDVGLSVRRGEYVDAVIGGVLTTAALGAVVLGYPVVATGIGAASIVYVVASIASKSN